MKACPFGRGAVKQFGIDFLWQKEMNSCFRFLRELRDFRFCWGVSFG